MEHQYTIKYTLEKINHIIEREGFVLEHKHDLSTNAFIFVITYNNENVASIQTYLLTANIVDTSGVVIGVNLPAFSISFLDTEEEYQGKGYASLLLIYALCYLKLRFPHVNYSVLDDDSDRSTFKEGNIYNSLGYFFQDPPDDTNEDNPNEFIIKGPEKQLDLDTQTNVESFLSKANTILNRKFGVRGGNINRKTRKAKKQGKHRKTKRTRRNKRTRRTRRNKRTKRTRKY
jgi:GNAT superfamily N-acetyltransferase